MSIPDKDYRENPKRAVYISGVIDQGLVDRLTPTINLLRLENDDPITAYVDSPGGSPMLAETIRWHLRAPNPDGKSCRLIAVVTARASSAAADFVALADYAIAYPYADFYFHGNMAPLEADLIAESPSVTSESATRSARRLQQRNEDIAASLAQRVFPRFVDRLSQFKKQFAEYLESPSLRPLAEALQEKLWTSNALLVEEALKMQNTIADLAESVSHLTEFKSDAVPPTAMRESEIFIAVLNRKVQLRQGERWQLSGVGLQEVIDDFNLLHDFYFGAQRLEFEDWNRTYGEMVLSDHERIEFHKLEEGIVDRESWLTDKSEPKLRPIWYLTISICRLLQEKDYQLPGEQAYWLGLIDEVAGSELPCERTAAERDTP